MVENMGMKKVVYAESGRERVVRGETTDRDDGFIEVRVGGRSFRINKNTVIIIKDMLENTNEPVKDGRARKSRKMAG